MFTNWGKDREQGLGAGGHGTTQRNAHPTETTAALTDPET